MLEKYSIETASRQLGQYQAKLFSGIYTLFYDVHSPHSFTDPSALPERKRWVLIVSILSSEDDVFLGGGMAHRHRTPPSCSMGTWGLCSLLFAFAEADGGVLVDLGLSEPFVPLGLTDISLGISPLPALLSTSELMTLADRWVRTWS